MDGADARRTASRPAAPSTGPCAGQPLPRLRDRLSSDRPVVLVGRAVRLSHLLRSRALFTASPTQCREGRLWANKSSRRRTPASGDRSRNGAPSRHRRERRRCPVLPTRSFVRHREAKHVRRYRLPCSGCHPGGRGAWRAQRGFGSRMECAGWCPGPRPFGRAWNANWLVRAARSWACDRRACVGCGGGVGPRGWSATGKGGRAVLLRPVLGDEHGASGRTLEVLHRPTAATVRWFAGYRFEP